MDTVQQTGSSAPARALVTGAAIGFALVLVAVTGGLLLNGADPVVAWAAGLMSAVWGGGCIGATVGLSRHHVALGR